MIRRTLNSDSAFAALIILVTLLGVAVLGCIEYAIMEAVKHS